MERRLNKKVESYISSFKDNIKEKATQMGFVNNDEVNQLIHYIYDYERLTFNKDDFMKRKRVKNFVPIFDRCCAKRATSEQCTRRKKEGFEYTHFEPSLRDKSRSFVLDVKTISLHSFLPIAPYP
jgi:hypothetical protein